MSLDRKKLRWNGWGFVDHRNRTDTTPEVWARLAEELGQTSLEPTPPTPLDEVSLPPVQLDDEEIAELCSILGSDRVLTTPFERALHARGRSYRDLLVLRAGKLEHAPDAVLYPSTRDEVLRVLSVAVGRGFAVVPYGGGSSVVGGVTAIATTGKRAVLSLDTSRMCRVLGVDHRSMTATAEAGIYGPALEAALARDGVTLGHYPQSFEFSTLGGWIAARGAGQQSNRYGKAEDWLVSARLATPSGLWATEDAPASAAGPRLGDLVVGSEGVLGVITDATFKVHPKPDVTEHRAYLFRSFDAGIDAIRAMVQAGVPVATMRLSDAEETRFYQQVSASTGFELGKRLVKSYLGLLRYRDRPCLFILGIVGDRDLAAYARDRAKRVLNAHRALPLGTRPGRRWYEQRFEAAFLRDAILDRGLGVETLETATAWSSLGRLYRAVGEALSRSLASTLEGGAKGVVMTHVSHSYQDGASLYFTAIFARDRDDPIGQWRTVKKAASDAIVAHGGTISHHHGVGEDHLPWLEVEKGALALRTLQAVRRELDPQAVMNPGKLIPNDGMANEGRKRAMEP